MTVVQRTTWQVVTQHAQAIEKALEKLMAGGIRLEDLTLVEPPMSLDWKTLRRSVIRHGKALFLFAVETTMDGNSFTTRGWVPEGARFPWSITPSD